MCISCRTSQKWDTLSKYVGKGGGWESKPCEVTHKEVHLVTLVMTAICRQVWRSAAVKVKPNRKTQSADTGKCSLQQCLHNISTNNKPTCLSRWSVKTCPCVRAWRRGSDTQGERGARSLLLRANRILDKHNVASLLLW